MQHLIEVKLAELNQLFNSMDPSPFRERDLDPRAEEFIVAWAQEHPKQAELKLLIHLTRPYSGGGDATLAVQMAVRHYFADLAGLKWREFRRLMREGRTAMLIGVCFIALCQLGAGLLAPASEPWHSMVREGLTVGGWVALWRPLEIYLYLWWPILRLRRTYLRLAAMEVEVIQPEA